MEVKIQLIINEYKEELAKLMNENLILRAQVKQLQNDLEELNKGGEEWWMLNLKTHTFGYPYSH